MSKQYSNLSTTTELVDQREQLLTELNRISANIEAAKKDLQDVEDAKSKAVVLGAEVPDMQIEHTDLSTKIEQAKKDLAELQAKEVNIKNDILKTQAELDRVLPILKEHNTALEKTKNDKVLLETEAKQIQKEIDANNLILEKLQANIPLLQADKTKLEVDKTTLFNDCDELQKDKNKLQVERDTFAAESEKSREDKNAEIAKLDAQIKDREEQQQLFLIEQKKKLDEVEKAKSDLLALEEQKNDEFAKKAGELSFKENLLEEKVEELKKIKTALEKIRGKQIPINI